MICFGEIELAIVEKATQSLVAENLKQICIPFLLIYTLWEVIEKYLCWNYGGSVEHNRKWILRGSHCGARFIVLSSFSRPI